MAKLGAYKGRLFVDFRFRGVRRREYLRLPDSPPNRKRAEAFVKLLEAELALGTFNYATRFPTSRWARAQRLLPPAPPPAFAAFSQEWLAERRGTLRPETAADYEVIVEHHLVPALGRLRLDEIHDGHIRRLINGLREKHSGKTQDHPLSPRRINMILARLRTILTTARGRGYLERHPMAGVRNLAEPRPEIDPLSPAEIRRFLAACPARYRPYYRVAFGTGLRPSEQLALRRDALDFGRRTIRVRVARTRSGEHEPKTRRSQRDLAMLPDVAAALRDQLARSTPLPFTPSVERRCTARFCGLRRHSNDVRHGRPHVDEDLSHVSWHPTPQAKSLM